MRRCNASTIALAHAPSAPVVLGRIDLHRVLAHDRFEKAAAVLGAEPHRHVHGEAGFLVPLGMDLAPQTVEVAPRAELTASSLAAIRARSGEPGLLGLGARRLFGRCDPSDGPGDERRRCGVPRATGVMLAAIDIAANRAKNPVKAWERLRSVLRDGRILLGPKADGTSSRASHCCRSRSPKTATPSRSGSGTAAYTVRVAGAGFEPATFGL
jgi:hypothetical protein